MKRIILWDWFLDTCKRDKQMFRWIIGIIGYKKNSRGGNDSIFWTILDSRSACESLDALGAVTHTSMNLVSWSTYAFGPLNHHVRMLIYHVAKMSNHHVKMLIHHVAKMSKTNIQLQDVAALSEHDWVNIQMNRAASEASVARPKWVKGSWSNLLATIDSTIGLRSLSTEPWVP